MDLPKLSRNETLWERIYDSDGNLKHLITSDNRRDVYYLYHVEKDGSINKIGKGKNPPDLHKRYLRGK